MNKEERKIKKGGYNIDQLVQMNAQAQIDGLWVKSRPLPYRSFWSRIMLCLDVIRYKADVIYWYKQ